MNLRRGARARVQRRRRKVRGNPEPRPEYPHPHFDSSRGVEDAFTCGRPLGPHLPTVVVADHSERSFHLLRCPFCFPLRFNNTSRYLSPRIVFVRCGRKFRLCELTQNFAHFTSISKVSSCVSLHKRYVIARLLDYFRYRTKNC